MWYYLVSDYYSCMVIVIIIFALFQNSPLLHNEAARWPGYDSRWTEIPRSRRTDFASLKISRWFPHKTENSVRASQWRRSDGMAWSDNVRAGTNTCGRSHQQQTA